ncbi:MAG: hypothetical protein QM737_18780 [Ferruginibacter sp.]
MKKLVIIFFITLHQNVVAQELSTTLYSRQDSKIWLNADSSFKYFYSVDTYRAWVVGKWTIKGKKIILKSIPVYDTLVSINNLTNRGDSLFLSRDEKSERVVEIPKRTNIGFTYEQNQKMCPTILILRNNKLYVVKNGKRQKKKIDNGYYIDSFDPWYTKKVE